MNGKQRKTNREDAKNAKKKIGFILRRKQETTATTENTEVSLKLADAKTDYFQFGAFGVFSGSKQLLCALCVFAVSPLAVSFSPSLLCTSAPPREPLSFNVMNLIKVTYIATRPDRDPEELAENIAREQSLEIVPELIPDDVASRFLGQVLAVEELDRHRWALTIGYPEECASGQVGQLLHLVYGNVSFYPRIRLTGLDLPVSLLARLPGPACGIAGIRGYIDVPDRALLMTVLKPRGSSPEWLAGLAEDFARGGGDILKDDQNIVETDIDVFKKRIGLCTRAIDRAAQVSGRRCLYLPHVAGSGSHLERQLETVASLGLTGVVMCSWAMGLETAAEAARRHGLLWLSHPAMAGVWTEPEDHGISTAVLLGTLVRAAGADISIFPGRGGRISSSHLDDETATCQALTKPLGALKPTLPCTGGGKTLACLPETAASHGPDCAVVIGGDLLRQGSQLETATRAAISQLQGIA
jgi:ribulose-bisphosphate carboxylase large chain